MDFTWLDLDWPGIKDPADKYYAVPPSQTQTQTQTQTPSLLSPHKRMLGACMCTIDVPEQLGSKRPFSLVMIGQSYGPTLCARDADMVAELFGGSDPLQMIGEDLAVQLLHVYNSNDRRTMVKDSSVGTGPNAADQTTSLQGTNEKNEASTDTNRQNKDNENVSLGKKDNENVSVGFDGGGSPRESEGMLTARSVRTQQGGDLSARRSKRVPWPRACDLIVCKRRLGASSDVQTPVSRVCMYACMHVCIYVCGCGWWGISAAQQACPVAVRM